MNHDDQLSSIFELKVMLVNIEVVAEARVVKARQCRRRAKQSQLSYRGTRLGVYGDYVML